MRPPRFLSLVPLCLCPLLAAAGAFNSLPDTRPLTWRGELADKMMDGLHRYIERKVVEAPPVEEEEEVDEEEEAEIEMEDEPDEEDE